MAAPASPPQDSVECIKGAFYYKDRPITLEEYHQVMAHKAAESARELSGFAQKTYVHSPSFKWGIDYEERTFSGEHTYSVTQIATPIFSPIKKDKV